MLMVLVYQANEACQKIRSVQAGGLPIFRLDRSDDALFYTPGYLGLVRLPDAELFEMMLTAQVEQSESITLAKLRGKLLQKAKVAQDTLERRQVGPFRPECLTLYLSNQCNLRCSYCYAHANPHTSLKLEIDAVEAAARLVGGFCREKNCALTTVIHGGGEPTLHRSFSELALKKIDEIAQNHQVPTFRYIATNGVMSRVKAEWLAQHFNLVGLSCDGPADIQNCQRPTWDGGESTRFVEQTAHILREQGCRFQVRVTLTKSTLQRQVEIVDYLCHQLSPEAIHIEPLYLGGRADRLTSFGPTDATEFVVHFYRARERARKHKIPLLYAGSRLETVHGPYCHFFRDVLNLVPGGVATACFKMTTAVQANQEGLAIGHWQRGLQRFKIDYQAITALRQSLHWTSNSCRHCFNQLHCVGECPDRCMLTAVTPLESDRTTQGFRCRIQKLLAMITLFEIANRIRAEGTDKFNINGGQTCDRNAWGTSTI